MTLAEAGGGVNETPPTHNNRSRGAGGVTIDSINTTIDFINDRV